MIICLKIIYGIGIMLCGIQQCYVIKKISKNNVSGVIFLEHNTFRHVCNAYRYMIYA